MHSPRVSARNLIKSATLAKNLPHANTHGFNGAGAVSGAGDDCPLTARKCKHGSSGYMWVDYELRRALAAPEQREEAKASFEMGCDE